MLPSRLMGRETEETFNRHALSTFFSSFISTISIRQYRKPFLLDANLESESCISHPTPAPFASPYASRRPTGLRHKISSHPRNPNQISNLSPHKKSPHLPNFASQRPAPQRVMMGP